MKPPIVKKLADSDAEIVRRSHADAIAELQSLPAARISKVFRNQQLGRTTLDNQIVIAHGLGRAPEFVWVSPPRFVHANRASLTAGLVCDAGTVDFSSGAPIDRTKVIQLGAFGFGIPIIVDVVVM